MNDLLGDHKIEAFQGEYRWLSNFWPAKVCAKNGLEYPTVEHAYVASKSSDPNFWQMILTCTAAEAKIMGRQPEIMRPDWADIKVDVMHDLIQQKFAHPELRQKLVATGNSILIEGNTWNDTFWGVCKGNGLNMLGKLLMAERARIVQSETAFSKPIMQKTTLIMHAIKEALGGAYQFFDVKPDDILVDDEHMFSRFIEFKPKSDLPFEDSKTVGKAQCLEFTLDEDDDVYLVVGEDAYLEVSAKEIYAVLYWGEATTTADAITDKDRMDWLDEHSFDYEITSNIAWCMDVGNVKGDSARNIIDQAIRAAPEDS